MYCPPVSGIKLAISALVSAPNRVRIPARTQTPSSSSGEPSCAAITPGLRKMPEPMTPPTTIMIVVERPREGSRPALRERGGEEGLGEFIGGKRGTQHPTTNIQHRTS